MSTGCELFVEDRVERETYSSESAGAITIGTRPVGGYYVRLLRFEDRRTYYVLDAQLYLPGGDESRLLLIDVETDADAIREAVAVADRYRGWIIQ